MSISRLDRQCRSEQRPKRCPHCRVMLFSNLLGRSRRSRELPTACAPVETPKAPPSTPYATPSRLIHRRTPMGVRALLEFSDYTPTVGQTPSRPPKRIGLAKQCTQRDFNPKSTSPTPSNSSSGFESETNKEDMTECNNPTGDSIITVGKKQVKIQEPENLAFTQIPEEMDEEEESEKDGPELLEVFNELVHLIKSQP
ncbi:hypothetical protein M3Y98_00813900 [Aphelenchoides besseyi]|nr:hypothetical protein M3Y98_00813900 [Aphelenchoides besseyi]KAI6212154.1 hypothetical protein M3Y96_00510300 [Aphelenchoides besseyi]